MSNNPVFPYPPVRVESPRAPNTIPTLPGTRLLNANTHAPPGPTGIQATLQPGQINPLPP